MGIDHRCDHSDARSHQCNCGLGADHDAATFEAWHERKGVPPLDSQVR